MSKLDEEPELFEPDELEPETPEPEGAAPPPAQTTMGHDGLHFGPCGCIPVRYPNGR